MEVKFGKKYLEELFYMANCSDKSHRYQPQIVKLYIKRVITLMDAPSIEALYPLNSLHYEVLTGDKKGMSSIRINDKYRLEFIVDKESREAQITLCTLIDISNHYK